MGPANARPPTDTSAADVPIAEPTVTADDDVLAASTAKRALSPDMPRVAWLRTQLMQLEANRRDRLVRVLQLIWVIFGCAVLGGIAGFLIGRPDRNLRSLFPHKAEKDKKPARRAARA
jgi:hypothetical protein